MSEYPSLQEIAADHNEMVAYIRYVNRCVDNRTLPLKFYEWQEEQEVFTELLFTSY